MIQFNSVLTLIKLFTSRLFVTPYLFKLCLNIGRLCQNVNTLTPYISVRTPFLLRSIAISVFLNFIAFRLKNSFSTILREKKLGGPIFQFFLQIDDARFTPNFSHLAEKRKNMASTPNVSTGIVSLLQYHENFYVILNYRWYILTLVIL